MLRFVAEKRFIYMATEVSDPLIEKGVRAGEALGEDGWRKEK